MTKLIIPLLIITALASCSTAKRTAKKIEKAKAVAIANPGAFAGICAVLFPVRDSLIKGDTVTVVDTVHATDIIIDTVRIPGNNLNAVNYPHNPQGSIYVDTVVITKTLPARTIYKTSVRVDTLVRRDRATEVALEEQLKESNDRGLELSRENDGLKEFRDSMRGKVHIPWWVMVITGLAVIGWAYWRIKAGALNGVISKMKGG